VVENERCKILWGMTVQCDHLIEARRPDIVVVEKENNKTITVDIDHCGTTECTKMRVKRLINTKISRGRLEKYGVSDGKKRYH